MTTDEVDRERLEAFLDGELDDRACAEMEARLRADPGLARRARELRALDSLLGELPQADASDVVARTLDGVAREGRASRFRGRWMRVAAAVLVLGGATIGVREILAPADATPRESGEPIEDLVGRMATAPTEVPEDLRPVAEVLEAIESIEADYFGTH
jgi:anti-sigma factor RsiW